MLITLIASLSSALATQFVPIGTPEMLTPEETALAAQYRYASYYACQNLILYTVRNTTDTQRISQALEHLTDCAIPIWIEHAKFTEIQRITQAALIKATATLSEISHSTSEQPTRNPAFIEARSQLLQTAYTNKDALENIWIISWVLTDNMNQIEELRTRI